MEVQNIQLNTKAHCLLNSGEYAINCTLDRMTADIYADITQMFLYEIPATAMLTLITEQIDKTADTIFQSKRLTVTQQKRILRRLQRMLGQVYSACGVMPYGNQCNNINITQSDVLVD